MTNPIQMALVLFIASKETTLKTCLADIKISIVRNKFGDIFPLFVKYDIDILGIAETKFDNSFTSAQFGVTNYKLFRQDRNSKGGGVMLYVKDSIHHRLLKEHSGVHMGIDYLTVEISLKSIKWNMVYIYRPPNVKVKVFCDFFLICVRSPLTTAT